LDNALRHEARGSLVNLLLDSWISIRRRSGHRERIAPWQVTDRWDSDPIARLASPRADFDGALAQFLVGLLQAALAPEDPRAWSELLDHPPLPDALKAAFEPFAPYFELLGDGPRFLQDLELDGETGKEEPIERLLIDSPGGNTLRLGTDHFVKGGRLRALCPGCAAAALLTLQVNAPSGGQGHRTGLRGGGPLTTLVLHPGGDLWRTLWMNVLPEEALAQYGSGHDRPEDVFPWLSATRTSEGGRETTLADVHPLQMFWAMPRRIRLVEPAEGAMHSPCDLCEDEPGTVSCYLTKNLGANYAGEWPHPLTPRYRAPSGELLPVHGNPQGVGHRNWLGLAVSTPDGSRQIAPVVRAVYADHRRAEAYRKLRLWTFGYDMDNMKARAWAEGEMPVYPVAPEQAESLGRQVEHLVQSEELAAAALRRAIKSALSERPEDLSGDPLDAGLRFWQVMESPFLALLGPLVDAIRDGQDPVVLRETWHRRLVSTAARLFDEATEAGRFRGRDPGRVARAWNGLWRTLHGPKIRKSLELPPPAKGPSHAKASGGADASSPELPA
jgi:CRISPR system Cascade subunit CasA